ncbi:sugar 3,4-ketoisomerase [Foetidibacter luteolus]|uniref:sugar 3,4-ketoisomerase n=1 Tax=Foetidibacter luteolus TaxID=2608880 RepID=UPI00129BEA7B|nr:FdtA/QdtA family cupin domain-containing protein [Foetidibacter luteolus]
MSNDIRIIQLPRIFDERGNLSVLQEDKEIPFLVKRVYWIYDVPGGEMRGSHAFKNSSEIIIALSGSYDVVLHDGIKEHRYQLNRSYYGLYVPKMTWRTLENFSTNSLALVITDLAFDEHDYIREFDFFKKLKQSA